MWQGGCMKWQPIETAPKDGTRILLGEPRSAISDGICTVGNWIDSLEDGQDYMGHDAGFIDVDYNDFNPSRSFGNPSHRYTGVQPTHWMPLPDPPEDVC